MNYINSIYAAGLKMSTIAVYLYLEKRTDKEGKCFPSIRTIAKDLNVSTRTIQRAIRELELNGFIRVEQRFRENMGNSSNMYFLKK